MSTTSIQDNALARSLQRETTAEVFFDDFSRGLYSTDASIYQIMPLGVVVPKTEEDVRKLECLLLSFCSLMNITHLLMKINRNGLPGEIL